MKKTMSKLFPRLFRAGNALSADRRGVSAVEFALIAPVFLAVLAGTVDVGRMIAVKASLESSVSTGANYVLLNGASLSSSTAKDFATTVAVLAMGGDTKGTARVTVNGGYSVTVSDGKAAADGNASEADRCYCPAAKEAGVAWKQAQCDAACPGGGHAGKFIEIRAGRPHQGLFRGDWLTGGTGEIGTSATVNP